MRSIKTWSLYPHSENLWVATGKHRDNSETGDDQSFRDFLTGREIQGAYFQLHVVG